MTGEYTIVVGPDGGCRMIYADELLPVIEALGGAARTRRASHVEPAPSGPGWVADMAPSGGPALGPFRTRQEALEAERDWLLENGLPGPL